MTHLSTVLKQRRKELGLTLAQIADAMDVAEATVQRWESGNIKSVRYDKIGKLAEVLKVQPSVLMGWEDSEKSIPHEKKTPDSRKRNIVKLAGRDGSYHERVLSDSQLAAVKAMIDQLPDASDDL